MAVFVFVTAVLLGLRAVAERVPGPAAAGVGGAIVPALTELPVHTTGPSRVPWVRASSRVPSAVATPGPRPVPHTTPGPSARAVLATSGAASSSAPAGVVSVSPRASAGPSASGSTESGVLAIEAEDDGNDRPAPLSVRDVAGASGGRVVTGIGDGHRLSFAGIDLAAGGDFRVTIAYVAAEDRWCYIGTGGSSSELAFPGGGGPVATVTVTLPLAPGRNTVEAGNTPGRWCPDLDRITVAPTDHPSWQRPE